MEKYETATLAGGCFWCLEAVFSELKGVQSVISGFSGGWVPNPSYRQVCDTDTGHAEVVQISFDPQVIRYADLLDIFFTIHDPTTLDRQGNDIGKQYRSAIFYHSPAQEQAARQAIKVSQAEWKDPIVTELLPFEQFYKAEDYHQGYYENNPLQPYCSLVIAPKVAKFHKKYQERLKA